MFYVKEELSGGSVIIKVEITHHNVYTYCSACGVEHIVDIAEVLEGGGDLESMKFYCLECAKSHKYREH